MKVRKVVEPKAQEAFRDMLAAGELSPQVAVGVRALLRDLAAQDIEMAMLDLAQLSRSVLDSSGTAIPEEEYPASVVICTEDGEALAGMCDGPEEDGSCPWADATGRVPCSGLWLATEGWQFKVAEDAKDVCPLAVVLQKVS